MTAFVPIMSGQWVLAYNENVGPYPGSGDLREALEMLGHGGSGWSFLHNSAQQFDVLQVEHVMPKTFQSVGGRRHWRNLVVATSDNPGEMLALRDKLFAIGFAADRAIQEETVRRISDFAKKTRAEALAKVHAALPHIFGRTA